MSVLFVLDRQARDSEGSCSAPMDESDRPDLSLLKPLWSLYTGMLEKEGEEKTSSQRILETRMWIHIKVKVYH